MVFIVFALVIGIVFGEFSALYPNPLYLLLAAVTFVVAAAFVYFRSSSRSWLFGLLTFVAFSFLGVALHSYAQPHTSIAEGRHTLLLTLNKPASLSQRATRWQCTIDSVYYCSAWHQASGMVLLYMPKSFPLDTIEVGSTFSVSANFRHPVNFDSTGQFNYADYCRRNGFCLTAYSSQFHIVDTVASYFSHKVARLQYSLAERMLHPLLSHPHQLVANAILLGVRGADFNAVRQQYVDAGIIHLLCLSGLHVGLFAAIVAFFFSWIGNSYWQRVVRHLLQIVAIWLFVCLTGMGPATVRAAIMFSFFSIGSLLCRRPYTLGCLASSAFFILCFKPMLLFDIGFQLSYSSMLGIVLLYPLLNNVFSLPRQDSSPWQATLKGLWNLVVLSFSAQLFAMPFVLFYFHRFQPYFLISNLLIVPFAGVILLLSLFLLVPMLSTMSAFLLNGILSVVDGITLRVSSLPHAVVMVPHFSLPMAMLLAVAILLLCNAFIVRKTPIS